MKKMLENWARKLIKKERLQVGYIAVINQINRIHLHLLMLGKNRHGKTLLDVSINKWQKKWNAQSEIQFVYDIEGVSGYLAGNLILKNEDLSDVFVYNTKLLKKLRSKEDLSKSGDVTGWDLNKSHYNSNVDKKQIRSQLSTQHSTS